MKPGHPVCDDCFHRPNSIDKPFGIACKPECGGPIRTIELPGIGQVRKRIGPRGAALKCARLICPDGEKVTRHAWGVLKGRAEPTKNMILHKDGSVEFVNEHKRRRIYPDRTLKVKIGDWEELGKISTNYLPE